MKNIFLPLLLVCFTLISCKDNNKSETTVDSNENGKLMHAKSSIDKAPFGTLPDGQAVDIYTLKNNAGMTVAITNYGGTIVSWTAPDKTLLWASIRCQVTLKVHLILEL
jgi:hypothetical protein